MLSFRMPLSPDARYILSVLSVPFSCRYFQLNIKYTEFQRLFEAAAAGISLQPYAVINFKYFRYTLVISYIWYYNGDICY